MGQGNRKAGPFGPPLAALDSLYNILQPKEGLQVKIIAVNYMEIPYSCEIDLDGICFDESGHVCSKVNQKLFICW